MIGQEKRDSKTEIETKVADPSILSKKKRKKETRSPDGDERIQNETINLS
jgi:hypothetical protein